MFRQVIECDYWRNSSNATATVLFVQPASGGGLGGGAGVVDFDYPIAVETPGVDTRRDSGDRFVRALFVGALVLLVLLVGVIGLSILSEEKEGDEK